MRSDAAADRGALPMDQEDAAAHVVLLALRGGDPAPAEALAARVGPEPLTDLAASPHGTAWAQVPRHVIPRSRRLAVLHAAARMFRFDGAAPHLGGDLAQSLVACLEADDLDWAELAARYWRQWTMHAGEVRASWPQAANMLGRFPEAIESRPGLLGSVAALAAAAGAPEAEDLWARTLAHPMLADHAQRRWELELEWARCHLLVGGGQPARAMTVLRRVQGGFGDLGSTAGRLAWTDATLELTCGLAWIGDGEAAIAVFDRALRHVEPGGELEAWIRGAGAYACAAAGDVVRAEREADAIRSAATDTGILALRALIPARLLCAAHRQDRAAVREAIEDARSLEATQAIDIDAAACWRVHAVEAAVAVAHYHLAREALDALDEILSDAPCTLPVHALRRDQAAARLGLVEPADLEERARRLGVQLPDLPHVREADGGPVDIQLFGAFTVRHDGDPVDDDAWCGRRQARLLLALLLARGGRVARDEAAELLWGEVDTHTATARINPLLHAIRSALGIARGGSRSLSSRNGTIELSLADADSCDLQFARSAAQLVEARDSGMADAALDAMRLLCRAPIEDLGTERGAAVIREELGEHATALLPRLAAAWEGHAAPDEVVEAVRAAFDAEPTELGTCLALLRLLRDRGDAPGASTAFHRAKAAFRDDLGLAPPLELVRLHAAIIGTADDRPPAGTSIR